MGTLSNLIEYQPFNMTPPGALPNPLTQQEFRVADTYANPLHFYSYPPFGPFTSAGIYEVNGLEFIQQKWRWPQAGTMLVTVPERPVDQGTVNALPQRNTYQDYNQPSRGTYLQPRQTTNSVSVAGNAPNQGVYTGFQSLPGSTQTGNTQQSLGSPLTSYADRDGCTG